MTEKDIAQPQLPLDGVGPRLKLAREAAGLSRAEIAQRTRISERVIALMEAGDYSALPSRTYAIGFTRSYARALGLEPDGYVAALRSELGMQTAAEQNPLNAYEPGDPARVPSARFAWAAALLALVLIAAGLVFWRNYYDPAMTLPSILPTESPSAVAATAPAIPASAPLASDVPVGALPPEATFTPAGAISPAPAALDPFGQPRGGRLNADPRSRRTASPAIGPATASPTATSTPAPAAPEATPAAAGGAPPSTIAN
ncbi:MAG: helix-turn-helix domain-containing protein [Novosphingobium sp.]